MSSRKRPKASPSPVSWLQLGKPPKASAEVQALLDRTQEKLGYVRNGQLAVLHRPNLVLGQDAISRAATQDPDSALSRRERELIALVVSSENRCEPCVFGHAAALREITGDPVLVDRIAVNYRHAGLSERERTLADYALKITRRPGEIEPEDLDALRKAGLTDLAILDAAAVAAYFNFSNRINSALGVTPNPEAALAHR
ncbi:peroxidase-related enzyme [Roseococcus pinisoli]|uniref:Peroxidase-related enzyme n=1 Tax=Roseococcus pinisoli TaxID=2835040 RepID=A0ABS5QIK0_9PROT|nr:peroxidase-related enzyme [Roseococcus pinisoli]MBS7813407.1 peroxidase-related enzyme [Roseococcus pinisoli]